MSLLFFPRPRSAACVGDVVSVEELQNVFESKRRAERDIIIGADAAIKDYEFFETKSGLMLTSRRAMDLSGGEV